MISELFIVSLVALLLVLMVVFVLCWVLRRTRGRNVTELQISAEQPARVLIIRTESDNAHQLLDRLLDRVFLQEPRPQSGEECGEETYVEPEEELGGERGAASLPTRAKALQDKLWRWMTLTHPPEATPPPLPTDGDQTDDLCPQQSDASQHASLSSQGACCSASREEEKPDESQF